MTTPTPESSDGPAVTHHPQQEDPMTTPSQTTAPGAPDIVAEGRRAARAVHVAVDATVASDLDRIPNGLCDKVEQLQEARRTDAAARQEIVFPAPERSAHQAGRFVKRPIVVEARPFRGTSAEMHEVYAWIERCNTTTIEGSPEGRAFKVKYGVRDGLTVAIDPATGDLVIPTLEGLMHATPGDWIIRGVKGEFYPCKPDVFAETYLPLQERGSTAP